MVTIRFDMSFTIYDRDDEKRRGSCERSFSFKDSAAVRRTFPVAGNRVRGSDAFVSRIANSEAWQVTIA